ncbi:MAG: hypothetical protein HC849_11425 [Oscillatoriales cyanobacterium RU_3_3]|nr:hypothetical protein [Oscillatoriales cyanobacterium RU_3_3]
MTSSKSTILAKLGASAVRSAVRVVIQYRVVALGIYASSKPIQAFPLGSIYRPFSTRSRLTREGLGFVLFGLASPSAVHRQTLGGILSFFLLLKLLQHCL